LIEDFHLEFIEKLNGAFIFTTLCCVKSKPKFNCFIRFK